ENGGADDRGRGALLAGRPAAHLDVARSTGRGGLPRGLRAVLQAWAVLTTQLAPRHNRSIAPARPATGSAECRATAATACLAASCSPGSPSRISYSAPPG